MKKLRILRYFLLMLMIFIIILFINFIVLTMVAITYDTPVDSGKFEMLISDEGDVIWSVNKPSEIPEHYTLSDVASFSRWYLNDYPVYTQITDDGLLVTGTPRNSIWRYNLTVEMSELESLIHIFPIVLIMDILLAIIIPLFILRRQEKSAEAERIQWISGVSHDIRTPLSIILGNAENLMAENIIQEEGFPEEIYANAKYIKTQALRIRELITNLNTENLLNFSIKKSNEMILLPGLIRDVICSVMEMDDENIYEAEFEADSSLCDFMIKADEGLIKRMLENLIINSMTHNPDGCKIKVTLSPFSKNAFKKNTCILAVSDDGIGADSDTLIKLNSKTDNLSFSEHGLGLTVVKKIAALYHYKISFSSQDGFTCNIEFAK